MQTNKKITPIQKEILIDFMMVNKVELFSSKTHRFRKEMKWNDVTELLNSNGPARETEKWKRVSFIKML